MKRWQIALLVGCVLLYFVAVTAWLVVDRRAAATGAPEFSALNTSPEGTSLALKYLQRHGAGAALLTRAIDAAELPHDAVIFRIRPQVMSIQALLARDDDEKGEEEGKDEERIKRKKKQPAAEPTERLRPLLTPAEEEWVDAGGRLVLALDEDYGPVAVRGSPAGAVQKVFPLWPALRSLDVPTLRIIEGASRAHAIFIGDAHPLLSRILIGRGEVILLGAPELFQNGNLQRGNALQILSTLAGGRRVFFDEVAHGIRNDAGLLELLKRWGLGPFVLLLAIAFVFRLWRSGTRVGEPERAPEDVRSEAIDLVESLGQLYRRSLSRAEMIALYQRHLISTISAQTHSRGEELQKRVHELAPELITIPAGAGQNDMSRAQFDRQIHIINEAFGRLDAKRR
jgi:hypothetical protein